MRREGKLEISLGLAGFYKGFFLGREGGCQWMQRAHVHSVPTRVLYEMLDIFKNKKRQIQL